MTVASKATAGILKVRSQETGRGCEWGVGCAVTYLDLLIAKGEPGCGGQQPDDNAGQRQYAGAHGPIEGSDAGRGILAVVTALGAGQALVLAVRIICGVLALRERERKEGRHEYLMRLWAIIESN